MWLKLDEDEKEIWNAWEVWDGLRYERDAIFYKKKKTQRKTKASYDDSKNAKLYSSESKGKRGLEDGNIETQNNVDVSVSSFHVPKRRKSAS